MVRQVSGFNVVFVDDDVDVADEALADAVELWRGVAHRYGWGDEYDAREVSLTVWVDQNGKVVDSVAYKPKEYRGCIFVVAADEDEEDW